MMVLDTQSFIIFRVIIILLLFIARGVLAQNTDQSHKSIHEIQSTLHNWDKLKIDSTHAEFMQGKSYAEAGNLRSATKEFAKGLRHNKSYALFDLGLIALNQTKYSKALKYFHMSYRVKKDPACLEAIKNTKRLISEHRVLTKSRRN